MMYDLAKMFLHCLNHWKLETPTARKQQMSQVLFVIDLQFALSQN